MPWGFNSTSSGVPKYHGSLSALEPSAACLVLRAVFEDRAVDADPLLPLALQVEEELLVLALAATDDRRQHEQPRAGRLRQHPIDHLLNGLGGDDPAAARAVRHAHAREQHAEVVV